MTSLLSAALAITMAHPYASTTMILGPPDLPTSDKAEAEPAKEEDPWAEYDKNKAEEDPKPAEPAAEPAAAAPAVGDPTAQPQPVAPAQPAPQNLTPPPRPMGGTGLFISAGVLAGLAIPAQIFAAERYKKACIDADEEQIDSGVACVFSGASGIGLRILAGFALLGSVGLSAGGGVLRGRRDAWDDAFTLKRRRDRTAFKIAGGVTLGVSLAAFVTSRVVAFFTLAKCVTISNDENNTSAFDDATKCFRNRQIIRIVGTDVGLIGSAAGLGMLLYGLKYDKAYNSFTPFLQQASIVPMFGRGFGGAALSGRF